jgi:hypothetical protein
MQGEIIENKEVKLIWIKWLKLNYIF